MISLPQVAITAKIYESANSLVYRGIREDDNTPVILKVLKEDYPTPAELTRYKQEYEITRSLNIDGVVRAYSQQDYQRTLVIILEDFGGESLAKLVNELEGGFPIPLPKFLCLAIEITEILGRIHSSNIIHKDISPSNIVLNPATGIVKLIDFGIATRLSRTNPTFRNPNVLEGTLAYISPEQTGRMNRFLDYRTDFYSLGVTFYELLTGKLPFTTTDAMELVHCHIAKEPLPPSTINPAIPQMVSSIVMKLMAKNAEERYQSAWGIKADLEECLQQLKTNRHIVAFPLGTQDISDKFQVPQKLYGREREVETLLTAFERVAGRDKQEGGDRGAVFTNISTENSPLSSLSPVTIPQSKIEMMLIAGYSGIGKSALVQEIYKPITQKRGYFISGKFDQFQRNIPYSAVVSAFQELAQQLLSEPESQLQKWRDKLLAALGANGQVIIDVIPEVELIIGKQPAVPEVGPTESQNRFNRVFQSFIRVFCSEEHPLVIFLDDLQWMDSATVKLIELMMTDSETQYLFLIGAYRDNEVESSHQLMMTSERLRREGVTINQMTLAPLAPEAIAQLIAETLNCDRASVQPLAELVQRKTGGNPFFVNEFLKTLYQENLITFNLPDLHNPKSKLRWKRTKGETQNPKWNWDLSQIEAKNITDNVVELMIDKLKKLPQVTQQILQLAACVGADFDLNTLSIICEKSPAEIFSHLVAAIQLGLILPKCELDENLLVQEYNFLHDRVQQAAHALIDESHRQVVHLQIGRNLLKKASPEGLLERLFEIVDHLNHGIELVTAQSEGDEIAQLNLIAGQKAKAASAYNMAQKYLATGREWLAVSSWQTNYNLTLDLYLETAEIAYLCGDFEQVESWVGIILQEAKTVLDTVKAYEVKIQTDIAQNQPLKAIDTGLQVLQQLGISFPETPSQSDIYLELDTIASHFHDKPIGDLIHLPEMTEPDKLAAMQILLRIAIPAYIAAPDLLPILASKQVNLSIQYGNASVSPFAYANFGGFILCGMVGNIESGYQFGQVALRLLSKQNTHSLRARILSHVSFLIIHWKEHVRETLEPFLEGYQSGLETGDLEFAAYCAYGYCFHSFVVGKELVELEREMTTYSEAIRQIKQETALTWNQIFHQSVLNLMGCSVNPTRLIGEFYNEEKGLPQHKAANDGGAIFSVYFHKFFLCYLFSEYAQAVEKSALVESQVFQAKAIHLVPLYYFYNSLARLATYPESSTQAQEEILKNVAVSQEKMKQWAHYAPMNYLHKYHLVQAETAGALGQLFEAEEFYEQAIQGAKENGYIQEEALAYELAAKFYLSRGRKKFAQTYMKEAHYCYGRWGAKAKVADLEARYPQLLTQSPAVTRTTDPGTTNPTTTTGNRSGSSLDLATVMKASQAISSEIVLDKLLASLMKILIENAGAQKGFLILETQGSLLIEASGTVEQEHVAVLQSIPIDSGDVSTAIANYVARTKETVVLHDASREGKFTNDPYIQAHQPKSILCAPLIDRGKLVSIVYLENNLTTEAFTPGRLEVLKLLSSQAAISIDLAKLYAEVRANESRLTQFLEAMPMGVAILDANGKPCYVNLVAKQLLGKDVIPSTTIEQLPEAYQLYRAGTNQPYPKEQIPILRALQGDRSAVDDMEVHQGNKIIPIESRGTPIFDENGNIAYAIAAFQDVTKRRQAEIAKNTFLAQMSHELRTPLNAILGFAQLMGNSSYLPPEHQENLSIIARSGEHLLTLINQVLDLSKIKAGQMALNEANFDLCRFLNDLENMFQLKANNKGLHLLFERTVEVPEYIRTDEVKLRQVLINLLSNAIKFTKAGSVCLKVKRKSEQQTTITFEIEDTGVGIAPDELDSIFKAFVQAKADRKFQEGTGLGLTIARSFVQLMGGDISVSSQVGKGTVFKFDITVSRIETVDINSQQPTSRTAPQPNQQSECLLSADVLTRAALAALPPDLVANLHQAILALDVERIETCIAQIRELNAPVAGAIAVLAKGFKYKQLLAFMQPATD
ncbi:AAA family ATPase [Coleofasciculus sp. FACHB-129]|uniref:AAA family ATPase n=1 Tax=Cyanophyceae TaxID=3028117 RepID=UPI0016846D56|nr:AAA family ATPase [Coleofasciculus sp. FACHB-129]MBD1895845.1 AAA family ATPase [Coleofasciculus sp. FACHB-129]